MEQRPLTHVRAGLIIAALAILANVLIAFTTGNTGSSSAGWINYALIIGGLIFFVHRHGRQQPGQSFGELFSFGFKATAVITVVFVAFTIIFTLVYPEFRQKALEVTRQQLEKDGRFSDAQIDQMVGMTGKYFWTFAIAGTAFMFVIAGAIGSLIGAAIAPKNNQTAA